MTPADLYAIGMESETAQRLMRELCALLYTNYPPDQNNEIPLRNYFYQKKVPPMGAEDL